MSQRQTVTACLIVIGSEILSGRTKDANLPFLARRLNELGVRLMEARVIPDVADAIVRAVNECRALYDYVFTTGGIGPTHDDITAEAVAEAFGVPLECNPEAVRRLEQHYANTGIKLNRARMRMARIPAGATLIDNPVSMAPGFRIGNVLVMAGVPEIMRAMFEAAKHEVIGGPRTRSRTVSCFVPEGDLAQGLGELQGRYPDMEIGSYPYFRRGRFGVSVVLRSTDAEALSGALEAL
ncbi:MAG: competence/damage-inducible protein A, partial [Kiloniellales bacterium]